MNAAKDCLHHVAGQAPQRICAVGRKRCDPGVCEDHAVQQKLFRVGTLIDLCIHHNAGLCIRAEAPRDKCNGADIRCPGYDFKGRNAGVGDEGREGPGEAVDAPGSLDVPPGYAGEARPECEPAIQTMVLGMVRDGRGQDHPIVVVECGTHVEGRCPRPCSVGTYGQSVRRALKSNKPSRIVGAVQQPPLPPRDAP